jgi:hypothetical protein
MRKLTKHFADKIYTEFKDIVEVYLKGSKTKSVNFDKYTNTGYIIGEQNPIFIKAIIRDVKPEELITRNIGLVSTGAKKIVIKERDVSLIRDASRILINSEEYYVYDDAVGNKLQIADDKMGYFTVLLFKKSI